MFLVGFFNCPDIFRWGFKKSKGKCNRPFWCGGGELKIPPGQWSDIYGRAFEYGERGEMTSWPLEGAALAVGGTKADDAYRGRIKDGGLTFSN